MKAASMHTQEAERIAIEALVFVAGDPQLLPRFLALTGIDAARIRSAASEPGFLGGVLGFIAAHEPTLLAFSQATEIAPEAVLRAMRRLPAGDDNHEQST